MLKNSDKSKNVYSGYVLAFDEAGSWSFDDFVSNDVISGVGNSSLVHTNNRKNNFLVLGEGPNDDINGCVSAAKEKFSINFSKKRENFA